MWIAYSLLALMTGALLVPFLEHRLRDPRRVKQLAEREKSPLTRHLRRR